MRLARDGSGGAIGWLLVKLQRRPYGAIVGTRVIVLAAAA